MAERSFGRVFQTEEWTAQPGEEGMHVKERHFCRQHVNKRKAGDDIYRQAASY